MKRNIYSSLIVLFFAAMSLVAQNKYAVIVGSFISENSAEIHIENLSKYKLSLEIMPMQTPKGLYYRVAEGSYSGWSIANNRRKELIKQTGIDGIWILDITRENISKVESKPVKSDEIDKKDKNDELAAKAEAEKQRIDKEKKQAEEAEKKIKLEKERNEKELAEQQKQRTIAEQRKAEAEARKRADEELKKKENELRANNHEKNDISANEKSTENVKTFTLMPDEESQPSELELQNTKNVKIDWDAFSREYVALIRAMVNKDYETVNKHIDDVGFFAIRKSETKNVKVTENYRDFENFLNFITLYKSGMSQNEFQVNLQKYALAYQRLGEFPVYVCNQGYYNKSGIFKNKVMANELEFDLYLAQSDLDYSDDEISRICNNVNIGVVRGEYLPIKGIYFAFDNNKLYLKFIDFADPCK